MAICDRATYRRLMQDTVTADADVDIALAEAQEFLEEETGRKFETALRTEILRVSSDGYVHPAAVPVASVTLPTNSTIDGNRVRVGGYLDVSIGPSDNVTLTYTGGYAAADLPRSLVKLVARIAYAALPHPSNVPAGAKSVTVGDVSYTLGDVSSAAYEDATLMRDVRKWDRQRLEWY